METKIFKMDIKEFNEEGSGGFSGYLSVFNNIDRGNDLVESGAFTKTLQENQAFPLYWAHQTQDHEALIGSFEGKEDKRGLLIDVEFLPDDVSQIIRQKVKILKGKKVKIGLSIGYETIKADRVEHGDEIVRHLQEVKLCEGSITMFPMNEQALVQAVKEGFESASKEQAMEFRCSACGETVIVITNPEPDDKAFEKQEPAPVIPAKEPPKEDEKELEVLRTLAKGFKSE